MRGFLAEVTLQSRLNHPSIVRLCDLFHHRQLYYVVMEYCDGGSVVELINKISHKSEVIIANIMRQLLRALSYLHSLRIIHRDIKLENIVFLKADDTDCIPIKIIDFGAAVKSEFRVVQNCPIAGTLTYLAPEVMKGVLTDKSDLWSTGVLMYLLLTGVSPFKGKN
jgi:calcium-dependent protein kinase